MVYDVKDKVALITGVGAGFGAELAMRLASKGAKVIGCDINAENGQRTVAALTSRFGANTAVFYECDVSEMAQIDAVFAKGIAKFGRLDIVVNNAGIGEGSKFMDDPEADFKLVVDIDLNAVIKGTQLGLAQMRKQGTGGVIVNVASMAGFIPDANMPVYVAAKMGVVGFTRSLGWKLFQRHRVRVNGIAPTFSMTNMGKLAASDPDFAKHVAASTVPISMVIDAFMRAIEDEALAGEILRITAQNGIDLLPSKARAKGTVEKKKDSKL